MIKLNLLEKKTGAGLPKVMGVDLNKVNLKVIGLAIAVLYLPEMGVKMIYDPQIDTLTNTKTTIEQENAKLKSEIDSEIDVKNQLDNFKKQVENLERKSKQVDQILLSKKNPKKILEKIARSIPEDAWIESLVINEKDEIEIKGGAYSAKSIGDFITITNDSPYFGGSLTPTQQESKKGTLDGISASYEYYEIKGQVQNYDMRGGN